MSHVFWLLATSLLIVGAAVALVVVKRLNRRVGLDGSFVGEAMLALAWVLPEILITCYELVLPGSVPTHPGNPYIETVAGLDPDTLHNRIATDLAGMLALLIIFIGVVIVFFLATALSRSMRARGLIVLALALAGLVFSVLVLDVPPRLPSAR
jgi:hypothetical protein